MGISPKLAGSWSSMICLCSIRFYQIKIIFGPGAGLLRPKFGIFRLFWTRKKMFARIVGYHFFAIALRFGTEIPSSRESVENMFIFFLTSLFRSGRALKFGPSARKNGFLPPKVFRLLKRLPLNFFAKPKGFYDRPNDVQTPDCSTDFFNSRLFWG